METEFSKSLCKMYLKHEDFLLFFFFEGVAIN